MNKVLIGITTWDRLPFTIECLESLVLTEMPFDCIIGDNNSGPDTVEYLKTWDKKILPNGSTFKVNFLDKNYGTAKANNLAVGELKAGQHFMKLDNDFVVPTKERDDTVPFLRITSHMIRRDWLDGVVDVLENSGGMYSMVGLIPHGENDIKNNFVDEQGGWKYHHVTTTGKRYAIGPVPHLLGAASVYNGDYILKDNLRFPETRIYGFDDVYFAGPLLKYGKAVYLLDYAGKHIDKCHLPEESRLRAIKDQSLRNKISVPKFPWEE